MKIKPVRTLPLRLRLKFEGRVNAASSHLAPWIDRLLGPEPATSRSLVSSKGYLELEIHPYALIGHQVASWAHGYLWAQDLGLAYLGGVLSRDPQGLFNFGAVTAPRPEGKVKRVNLLWVSDERDPRSLRILRKQVARAQRRYPNRVLVFKLALDPARWDQVPAEDILRNAVELGYKGTALQEQESHSDYVAIHIRRGSDIHMNHISGKEGINRWVLEDWHASIIKNLRSVPGLSDMEIRVYALGTVEDFPLLSTLDVTLKLNGDRDTDLIEMAAARLIVLSPSSFSFTAALVSRSVILGRTPWWHRIPDSGRWVKVDADGSFDGHRLSSLIAAGR